MEATYTISLSLAYTTGWKDLDETTVARLSLFVVLHDISKVNVGFQTQIWGSSDFPERTRRPSRAGHTQDLTPVLNGRDSATCEWFFDALGWWWNATASWDNCGGETVCSLSAALSHHGQPLQLVGSRSENLRIWRPFGGLDPREHVSRIGQLAHSWFPKAFAHGVKPLPSASAFQHHFLRLCNLADWIGSDEMWFQYVDEPHDDYIAYGP